MMTHDPFTVANILVVDCQFCAQLVLKFAHSHWDVDCDGGRGCSTRLLIGLLRCSSL